MVTRPFISIPQVDAENRSYNTAKGGPVSPRTHGQVPQGPRYKDANAAWKAQWGNTVAWSTMLAVAAHMAVFVFWPAWEVSDEWLDSDLELLALALGRTVNELENTLGSGELTEWLAYYRLEPFGQERDNYHAATIATTIANYSGKLKTAKQIQDFMFSTNEDRRNRETGKTLAIMNVLARKKT